jgi:long-chain acyl-CoA synthetase
MANRLTEVLPKQAERYGNREAYRFCWRKDGEWLGTSWAEFNVQVNVAAHALCQLNLNECDRIAICSPNTPQILITEFGAFYNRLAAIPIYAGSSQEQFNFIVSNGEARVIFVGDKHQYPLAYNYWKQNPEKVEKIIIFKNDGLALQEDDTISCTWDDFVRLGMNATEAVKAETERRRQSGVPSDMATLIYTSGTTGEPKGVVITHSNYDAAIEAHLRVLTNVSDKDLSMSFLPMSHILEKAWCMFCINKGITMAVNYDPRLIQTTIHDVHPTIMCCVPRFWEKVYAGVKEKIAVMSRIQRIAVARALKVGKKRNIDYIRQERKVPYFLEKEYQFWDKNIFLKLKKAIGIPNANMFPTAGAPLSDRICQFIRSVGINITVGYGLSETTATVTFFRPTGYEIGTVGKPLEGVNVKIDKNGEILVKAKTVTPGYYKNEDANKQAFTDDGYFRTGDAGFITPSGALVLTERVKDLFKTSNGKYIAPQAIESRLAENKYIDEAAVIGDNRKFVSALIVPNLSHLRKWAENNGIPTEDTHELITNPTVVEFVMSEINQVQKHLAEFEKIKRITLLPTHFSIMNGEVTNTMKVRRPIIAKRYAREIEAMYSY